MKHLCNESNEYSVQKDPQNFDCRLPTLKLFLATLRLSGYVPLPRRSMYWEAKEDIHNSVMSAALSRNRFSFIINNIHFANNNNLSKIDKFGKVRPLYDHINVKCLANFHPEQALSIAKAWCYTLATMAQSNKHPR